MMTEEKRADIELEMARIHAGVDRTRQVFSLAGLALRLATFLFAVRLFFNGLQSLAAVSPDTLSALAIFVDKLNVGNVSGYILACCATAAWRIERRGKKRAIELKGYYQRLAERGDSYRSSSGLTPRGDTPKGGTP